MAYRFRFAAASALAAALSLAATPALARGHYHHWHHHDGIDGGDVLAGAVILGGIAAIASAASHNHADQAPPPPVPDDRQGYAQDGAQRDQGLDRAAGLCADAIARGPRRVDTIDGVTRDRDGWSVEGTLTGGDGFDCRIGNDGQVLGVNVGGPAADADGQGEDGAAPPQVDNRPEWHGDDARPQSAPPQGDDRYSTSQAPDFGGSA